MTTAHETTHHPADHPRRGIWLILLGVLSVVLGLIGLFMTFTLTLVGTVWYGALMAVLGAALSVYALTRKEKTGRWTDLLLGLVYLAVGVFIVAYPLTAALTLTLLIGIALVAIGIMRIVWGLNETGGARLLAVVGGVLSIILGGLIILEWPLTGLWVLGLFIAVDLIMYGITAIGFGWKYR